MTKVYDRLYVLVLKEIVSILDRNGLWFMRARIHATSMQLGTKVHYQRTTIITLSLERGANLYLNIVDPDIPLFMPQTFVDFMNFSQKHYSEGMNLLIHCNLGESRAPSLALLFMAKGMHVISDRSYEEARREFQISYPGYMPGLGIFRYFTENWNELGKGT